MSGWIYMCIFLALALSFWLYNSMIMERRKEIIGKPFEAKWANAFYCYSFNLPFAWFIDEKGVDKKTKAIKKYIADANLRDYFNYRSYMALRVLLLMATVLLFVLINFVLSNGDVIWKALFNIDQQANSVMGNTRDIRIMMGIFLLVLNLLPNVLLRRRAELLRYYHIKDTPVIQLFVILMLRSKKPIADILFALSKINTRYRKIFEVGYRIFLRNREEGLNHIYEGFKTTDFAETVSVLKDMNNYSREESITLLEHTLEHMVEKSNSKKRRRDLSQLVYSQGTIAIPFIAVILLGGIPLVVYGISLFQSANLGF